MLNKYMAEEKEKYPVGTLVTVEMAWPHLQVTDKRELGYGKEVIACRNCKVTNTNDSFISFETMGVHPIPGSFKWSDLKCGSVRIKALEKTQREMIEAMSKSVILEGEIAGHRYVVAYPVKQKGTEVVVGNIPAISFAEGDTFTLNANFKESVLIYGLKVSQNIYLSPELCERLLRSL